MQLKNRKILFIGTGFYKYDDAILKRLEGMGAVVHYFSSIRKISYLEKIKYLRSKNRIQKVKDDFVTQLLVRTPRNIDIVFCIKGENLNENHINMLKDKYSNAKTILYLWDSIIRLNNWNLLHSYFEKIYTFDRLDSVKYNLSFRPLFYTKSSDMFSSQSNNLCDYDFSFVGEFHTDRYEILSKIKKQIVEKDKTYCFRLYIDRYGYFLNRFVYKRVSPEDRDILVFKKISYKDYLNITNRSKAIIDIENPLQSGLTIRSIETLALGKFLVTTNSDISNYKDIDTSSYCIINRDNPDIASIDCLENSMQINERYSIEAFVNDLFL